MGARCGFGCGPRRPAAGNVLAARPAGSFAAAPGRPRGPLRGRAPTPLPASDVGLHRWRAFSCTREWVLLDRVVVRSVGRSAMAGWLAQLVPYRGWLVKGVGGGALVRPGPAPHASRALRVPAGPAAPALDPEVPAGPGQRETAGRAVPCPLVAPRRLGRVGRYRAAATGVGLTGSG